ncbi:hypothetical protein [Chromobacterium violaceum]|uniref:hypothetical protein n=1 Tax=Chromobacterium violaceum TaxID=536 RepID=UPI001593A359|nr:hypothetical protein [Chromobacterium violaceum]
MMMKSKLDMSTLPDDDPHSPQAQHKKNSSPQTDINSHNTADQERPLVAHPETDDSALEELLAFIASRPDTDHHEIPDMRIPEEIAAYLPESEEEATELLEQLEEWNAGSTSFPVGKARFLKWMNSPLPSLARGIQQALLEMQPPLPSSNLCSYEMISDLLDNPESLTVLQEDALITLRVLLIMQRRRAGNGELERNKARILDMLSRLRRELPIWQKQGRLHRVHKAQTEAGKRSSKYAWAHPKWRGLALEMWEGGAGFESVISEIQRRHHISSANSFGRSTLSNSKPNEKPSRNTIRSFLDQLHAETGLGQKSTRGRKPRAKIQ